MHTEPKNENVKTAAEIAVEKMQRRDLELQTIAEEKEAEVQEPVEPEPVEEPAELADEEGPRLQEVPAAEEDGEGEEMEGEEADKAEVAILLVRKRSGQIAVVTHLENIVADRQATGNDVYALISEAHDAGNTARIAAATAQMMLPEVHKMLRAMLLGVQRPGFRPPVKGGRR